MRYLEDIGIMFVAILAGLVAVVVAQTVVVMVAAGLMVAVAGVLNYDIATALHSGAAPYYGAAAFGMALLLAFPICAGLLRIGGIDRRLKCLLRRSEGK